MATIVLKKIEARWVADVNGTLHDFRIVSPDDDNSSFRSIGIHRDGAVFFHCGMSGDVIDVKLLQGNSQIDLEELQIPSSHSLSRQIDLVAML